MAVNEVISARTVAPFGMKTLKHPRVRLKSLDTLELAVPFSVYWRCSGCGET